MFSYSFCNNSQLIFDFWSSGSGMNALLHRLSCWSSRRKKEVSTSTFHHSDEASGGCKSHTGWRFPTQRHFSGIKKCLTYHLQLQTNYLGELGRVHCLHKSLPSRGTGKYRSQQGPEENEWRSCPAGDNTFLKLNNQLSWLPHHYAPTHACLQQVLILPSWHSGILTYPVITQTQERACPCPLDYICSDRPRRNDEPVIMLLMLMKASWI